MAWLVASRPSPAVSALLNPDEYREQNCTDVLVVESGRKPHLDALLKLVDHSKQRRH
jgi:hypothetical protein